MPVMLISNLYMFVAEVSGAYRHVHLVPLSEQPLSETIALRTDVNMSESGC